MTVKYCFPVLSYKNHNLWVATAHPPVSVSQSFWEQPSVLDLVYLKFRSHCLLYGKSSKIYCLQEQTQDKFVFSSLRWSCYIVQAGLELTIFFDSVSLEMSFGFLLLCWSKPDTACKFPKLHSLQSAYMAMMWRALRAREPISWLRWA